MSDIFIFSGLFCCGDSVAKRLVDEANFKFVTDSDIIDDAVKLSGLSSKVFEKTFSNKTSVFNKFSREKEKAIAWLRLALAKRLVAEDSILLNGFSTQLLSQDISHVLKVCVIDDLPKRLEVAAHDKGLSESEAKNKINKSDLKASVWTQATKDESDPWKADLYDMVLPVPKTGVEQSAKLIEEQLNNVAVKVCDKSKLAAIDFLLAAEVETVLANAGHDVVVTAKNGNISLSINKKVLLVDRLEKELSELVTPLEGVKSVKFEIGKDFYEADIYRRTNFELPSKVLLVDDEREFVQTLSERLMLRDLGSAVAYDGESALELVREDEPEVMILDLKMPGIDGIEVLRRVKESTPCIQVIILTGHGSEEDRKKCMELGAFAYLNKPVDIDVLSTTLKEAYEKARSS